jgi:hypothetical protein
MLGNGMTLQSNTDLTATFSDTKVERTSPQLDTNNVKLRNGTSAQNVVLGKRSIPKKQGHRQSIAAVRLIRWGIWTYFILLIFEGVLRKWIVPGLATPLLVVRDPIAIAVLWLAVKSKLLPLNIFIVTMVSIGTLGIITALTLGHGSLVVALYGARPMIIHLPFAFVIGRVLNRSDVINYGKLTLLLAVPMTALVFLQFYSPQSAFVNRGVGGDMEGAGFSGAMGYMRPPGTFSFTNGLTLFFGLVIAFIFYFWLNTKRVDKTLLWLSTASLLIAIPLSISRSLVFQVALSGIFSAAILARQPKYLGKLLIATVGIGLLIVLASLTPAFQTAVLVMTNRFSKASKAEGGLEGTLVDRFLGGMVTAVVDAPSNSLVGAGVGLGTNVGAKYTTGEMRFLIAEGEWARSIGELGAPLGLLLIALRVGMATQYMIGAYRMLAIGDPLPWLLMSFGFLIITQGGWAQPTSLGFFTIITGLVLASFRKQKRIKKSIDIDTPIEGDVTIAKL